jgi:hypothetical protein
MHDFLLNKYIYSHKYYTRTCEQNYLKLYSFKKVVAVIDHFTLNLIQYLFR